MKRSVFAILLTLAFCAGVHAEVHTAASLSYTDVQAALDLCSPGDTLSLPAGDVTSDWSAILSVPNGVSVIGQGRDSTIMRNSTDSYYMMYFNYGDTEAGPVEISGFSLYGPSYGESGSGAIKLYHCEKMPDVVIHGLRVESFNGVGINFSEDVVSGLVYDCIFRNIYPADLGMTGYGVALYGDGVIHSPPLGTAEAVFVEDCLFENVKHGVAILAGAHGVVRYCVSRGPIYNRFMLDVHGRQSASQPGASTWEFYHNVLFGSPSTNEDEGIGLRGGDGVAFNNQAYDLEDPGFPSTPSAHKAIRVTIDTEPATYHPGSLNPMYFWGNTLNDVALEDVSVTTAASPYVAMGSEYFMDVKPGYTPFVYPHPDNGGSGQPQENVLTVTIEGDTEVVAVFERVTSTLTLTASPPEGGTVTSEKVEYAPGEVARITAVAAPGWRFVRWEKK